MSCSWLCSLLSNIFFVRVDSFIYLHSPAYGLVADTHVYHTQRKWCIPTRWSECHVSSLVEVHITAHKLSFWVHCALCSWSILENIPRNRSTMKFAILFLLISIVCTGESALKRSKAVHVPVIFSFFLILFYFLIQCRLWMTSKIQ